ncbi:phosphotransferase family protein [Phaeobacter sp. C3_T13_0]|uniref:phosphotransferase family protein n=1 Tax=Phaeobacter cretensis TaxID=3342641 RepID=UPI0039BC8B61
MGDCAPRPLVGGRSNRVWRLGDVVVKLYCARRENPLFANDPLREHAILTSLSTTGFVPSPLSLGRFEDHDWLAYRHTPGVTWASGAGQVATILGRLHEQPPVSGLPTGVNGSDELALQTRQILDLCKVSLDLRKAEPTGHVALLASTRLIHGDPVPGNIVVSHGHLTLIDWQCPQIGDPAEDIALFLSPAMQQIYRGEALTALEESEFLATYPDPEVVARYQLLKPWYHWRMASYCRWRDERDGRQDSLAYQLERAALDQCMEVA